MISSAGILLYRKGSAAGTTGLDVRIGHMGGPFWARKDTHAWSIPKGEYLPEEEEDAQRINEARSDLRRRLNLAEEELRPSAKPQEDRKSSRPIRAGDTVQLKAMGIEEYLKIYQDFYASYLANQ